ncbi:uncharacterized protein LOC110254415 [Exaiptasia diaphana]|uniref:Capsule synthesis protein CapA domain-containing protein n=1 Tax=Exaiptasia diaphana TaxID=2652724 RepID=A0A913YB40_EXADI|nr:uncharacterized protein LOC110254415 [Exaiptasia diaphana]
MYIINVRNQFYKINFSSIGAMKRGHQDFNLLILTLLSSCSLILSKDTSVTLVFVGDIAPDGVIFYQDKHAYCSYNQTFELVAPHLQQSDLTIGNLEAPFVTEDMEKYESKEYYPRLRSKPESAYSLKYAGFNILGLNNNHLTDFKEKPIKFTVNLLNKIGIKTFGYTSGTIKENRPQIPLIVNVRGIKIGFLGYCDIFKVKNLETFHYTCIIRQGNGTLGPAIYTDENASRDVTALKKNVDIVVVSMHWGKEYYTNLTETQLHHYVHLKNLGVHLIIGSHPHVLQGHTATKSFLTAFSLGNFLFEPHGSYQGVSIAIF